MEFRFLHIMNIYLFLGDVVGCYLDMDNGIMTFTLSGRDMGIAFENFLLPGRPIYPAISLGSYQRILPNLHGNFPQ
jgi:hypothetical protein